MLEVLEVHTMALQSDLEIARGNILKHLVNIHTFTSQDTMKWLNHIVHTAIFSKALY